MTTNHTNPTNEVQQRFIDWDSCADPSSTAIFDVLCLLFVPFVWFVWFVWFVFKIPLSTTQTNLDMNTHHTDNRDKTIEWNSYTER